jgi:hypothetical protein
MSAEYPWALGYDFMEIDDEGNTVDMQCWSEKGGRQCLRFRDHSEAKHWHRELSWTDEEEED